MDINDKRPNLQKRPAVFGFHGGCTQIVPIALEDGSAAIGLTHYRVIPSHDQLHQRFLKHKENMPPEDFDFILRFDHPEELEPLFDAIYAVQNILEDRPPLDNDQSAGVFQP